MRNLRTLGAGILLFCIASLSSCFGSSATPAPEPSPTPTIPPSPTATATPLPSFGPFIPLGQPVHRNLGTSTEVVRNCVPGAVDPIVKTPSRSLIASHNVEWSVAGTAGIGTSIGGGVLPVEVNLDLSLTTTYGQGYSETTERGTGWQLPAKPNNIVTYILEWGEKWQPGFVEVRLWNQPAIKIDVFYRTDVTSEIVAEDAQDCEGTRTGEPVPTFIPELTKTETPSPTATDTPLPISTSTATPASPTAIPMSVPSTNILGSTLPWLSETGGIPETGNEYSIDLLAGQVLLFTGGEFQYQNIFCSDGENNICVLVYKATKPQIVKLTKLYTASNYVGLSDTYTPEQAVAQKEIQFWQPPNCISGCTTAVVYYVADGSVFRKETLSVNE